MKTRTSLIVALAVFLSSQVARAYVINLPVGYLGPDYVIETRTGPLYNAILSAPAPLVPAGTGGRHAQGVYIIADINIISGTPGHVRILQSSGDPMLDRAAEEALVQWRFRPRSVWK